MTRLAALVLALSLLSSQVSAQSATARPSADEVVGWLRTNGFSVSETSDGGEGWRYAAADGPRRFFVLVNFCGAGCEIVSFVARFPGAVDLEALNDWNANQRFSSAHVWDVEGQIVTDLQMDIMMTPGEASQLAPSARLWRGALESFTAYVIPDGVQSE